ncbi:MAG: bifunctional riboflavin kinase/FAD synthetase [Acidithiobacillus sp.]
MVLVRMSAAFAIHRSPRAASAEGLAVTIGNFDGVHRGHQALLGAMKESGLPRAVLTFEPLPREYFQGREAPPRLTSLREKVTLLRRQGVNQVLCLPFRRALAQLPAANFARDILVRGLHTRALYVGHDFRFGAGRAGDFELLQRMGRELGFTVHEQIPFLLDGQRVSSTGIRAFLQAGAMDRAAGWLGRPYSLCGRVVHGDHLGRELGFPTANIPLCHRPVALRGIFAGVLRVAARSWPAAVSIGMRPTVQGRELMLEAHALDASPDLYGQRAEVELHKKLRDEIKYPDLDTLKAAIAQDVLATRAFFAGRPHSTDDHGLQKHPQPA